MTAAILALTLAAMLIASALFGPHLLRRAAPTLSTVPRVASYGLITGAVLWIAALVVIGPLVAWFSSGPAWLPAYAAQVCSRCLAAATPFTSGGFSLDIPAVVPLALPALGGTGPAS